MSASEGDHVGDSMSASWVFFQAMSPGPPHVIDHDGCSTLFSSEGRPEFPKALFNAAVVFTFMMKALQRCLNSKRKFQIFGSSWPQSWP